MRTSHVALWLGLIPLVALPAIAGPLDKLIPGQRVSADPNEDYLLTETDGPWFVLATTFSGEGAEEQAHELALELRRRYRLPAYLHAKEFRFTGRAPGRGIDEYGNPLPLKYKRKGSGGSEIAVLVGNFESIDDPQLEKTLAQIKTMRPDTLDFKKRKKTSQNLALMRTIHSRIIAGNKKQQKGPMGHAFAARNPLLSREYFVPKGVDEFVAKLNKDVQYSLLDCPGRYTMKVATFRGASMINPMGGKNSSGSMKSRLDEAADKAHQLTLALRDEKLGYEAYEFHNRTESIVTIGSFDTVATVLPNGSTRQEPGVAAIIRTFAAGDKPWIHPKAGQFDRAKISQVNHTFQSMSAVQSGMPVAGGIHPKHLANIPFDIMPTPYEVPKRSISRAYTKKFQ